MPIYLKYGTINGDVTASTYRGWIELDSFQWGATSPPTTPGTAGKVSLSDITVSKRLDAASVQLINQVFTGSVTQSVTIVFSKDNATGVFSKETSKVPYLRYMLQDTLVSSYSFNSGGDNLSGPTGTAALPAVAGGLPMETLTLNFAKVVIDYTGQNGTQTAGWPVGTTGT